MSYIRCTPIKVEMLPWYKYLNVNPVGIRKIRIIAKLLLNVHHLNSCRQRYSQATVQSALCDKCDLGCTQNVEHILFNCPALSVKREYLWRSVTKLCPVALIDSLNAMDVQCKVAFLLSGFHIFTSEWHEVYKAVANFIYYLYCEATIA